MSDDAKKPETPQGRAARLMQEIEANPQATYAKGQVKNILSTIAQMAFGTNEDGCRATTPVDKLQRGDVFVHKLVGGKIRPWIVLRVNGDVVTAVSMSSGDSAPGMTPSQCRLWPGSWIGTTVTLVAMGQAMQEVTRPYTNAKHLREVEQNVAKMHGLCVPAKRPAVASVSEIAKKLMAVK